MLKPPFINDSELHRKMGRSLFATQVLDHAIVYYMALWTKSSPAESIEMVEKHLTKAHGQLVRKLDNLGLKPDWLEDRLEKYRDERNWLVHHIYSKSIEDLYSETKCMTLLERIDKVHAEAKALTEEFMVLNDRWMQESGISEEDLEKEMKRKIAVINSQE